MADDGAELKPGESGQPVRSQAPAILDSPFQVAEPAARIGFVGPNESAATSLFATALATVTAPVPRAVPPPPANPAVPSPPAPPAPAGQARSNAHDLSQLALRAIFGVDRELNADELLLRAGDLPGIRQLARVGPQDMATLDALGNLLPNLGFGSGTLQLHAGPDPLEFIREGSIQLAVLTDGGFAPGVRESLMIVARELDRLG